VFWETAETGSFSCGIKGGNIAKYVIWLILC